MKYKKKPIIIDAVQFTARNIDEVEEFVGGDMGRNKAGQTVVATQEGALVINQGDFIIKTVSGKFITCSAETFNNTYEKL